MNIFLVPLLQLMVDVLSFYRTIVLIYVLFSWLDHFGIVNRYNQFIYTVHMVLFRLTEPVLRRVRYFIPPIAGIDFSPVILFFLIYFVQNIIIQILIRVT